MSSTYPLIFDGHNDLLSRHLALAGLDFDRLDISQEQPSMHTDLVRLRRGGVGAQFWSVWAPSSTEPDELAAITRTQIDAMYRMCDRYSDRMALARTADEVEQCFADGRIASLLGVEGGHLIHDSLEAIVELYDRGVRYLTLTHTANTNWADSATDRPAVGGLNDFGERVVSTLNELGMLVDLSHTHDRTIERTTAITRAPLFFSHSGARAVSDHPRNVSDSTLRDVAASGGIVMAVFLPEYLSAAYRAWANDRDAARTTWVGPHAGRLERRWLDEHPSPPCGIPNICDHIEHIREVAGIEHVGLGSDFDGMSPPDDIASVDRFPALLDELDRRGWTRAELTALAHGNMLRVLRDTEDAAR